jgi:hypothetical protein
MRREAKAPTVWLIDKPREYFGGGTKCDEYDLEKNND